MKRPIPPHPRFGVLRSRLPIVPLFAWHVAGRKMFDTKVSKRIKAMWKLGNYGIWMP